MLAQACPGGRRKYAPVRLDASRGRVRVEYEQLSAEIDSQVWQDGSCAVAFFRLMEAVAAGGASEKLVAEIEDDSERLRMGESLLPCVKMQRERVTIPGPSCLFFASGLGMVPTKVPALRLAQ